MGSFNNYVENLVYPKEKLNPDNFRKGKLFIYSLFFFLALMSLVTPLIALTSEEQAAFAFLYNAFIALIFVAIVFLYKRIGMRTLWVNIINCLFCLIFTQTYSLAGGIYSSDNATALIFGAWAFLVADRITGAVWFLIIMAIWVFLYYAEMAGFRDFMGDLQKQTAEYALTNYLSTAVFMIVIFWLYEAGKQRFVREILDNQEQISQQKKILELKSNELEAKNADITASINYASRIQYAVLPREETIYRSIPLSFIIYKPKDIVSGDFFWFHEIDRDNYLIACADCTGHGVPGAMMTVIASSLLNQTVIDNKITQPSQILLVLDNLINVTLKQQKQHEHFVQDGMDLALLKVNKTTKEFIFSSAKRPAIFFRDKQMQEFKGSKHSLGGMITGCKTFQETKINYQEDDILYFYTDGCTDQFGGPKGKKYSSKKLKETLANIHRLPIGDQKSKLSNEFLSWKGHMEQVDDILIMGIRF